MCRWRAARLFFASDGLRISYSQNTWTSKHFALLSQPRRSMRTGYAQNNTSKATFDDLYVQGDPRAYFSALGALDYMTPDLAAPLLRPTPLGRIDRFAHLSL
jgi:hypothetical protein